jgi:hypothetical protein
VAAASTYFKDAVLNQWFRGVAPTIPGTTYFALYLSDPGPANTGTEVSGGGYARIPIVSNTTNWTAPADNGLLRRIQNALALAFGANPSAGWGVVSHWGLLTAPTGGNLLIYGELDAPRTINALDLAPGIPIGLLAVDMG